MHDKKPFSFFKNQALALHRSWIENLSTIKQITEPTAKQAALDDLRELAADAADLLATGELHPQEQALLRHIVDRTIDAHVAISRASNVVSC